jgi:hypothetical protein
MIRTFSRPIPLVLALAVCTFIPVMMAAVSLMLKFSGLLLRNGYGY